MSTQEIRDIYKKVQITREQTNQRTKDVMNDTLEAQLTRVASKYMALLQNPKVSASDMDEAKRDMTNTLDILQMDSDHDVIMALSNNAIKKHYVEKLK